ncbi:MAG: type II toxin-antitoxin system PemK/MazF family toxin [Acidiphilium sp.]
MPDKKPTGLQYHPQQGEVLICDFTTGFQPPEMVKKRPVVIVSPRRRDSALVIVVPLSSVEPQPCQPWHYALPQGAYPPARSTMWAKCDMVYTVALRRLDRVMTRHTITGKRVYQSYALPPDALAGVLAGIRAAMGLT